ncbi:MAG: GNAT family N-acetyltransferase [Bacteroides sp.]|nr:GNAT family N-acetyltransferase [Bacteroides sp.]
MKIIPITLRSANDFVAKFHRHHKPTVVCKFSIGCEEKGQLVGVAICGRPVSRHLDDGKTLEINRLCTDGTKNACSKLYSACVRIAKEMGYERVITYILASENGASLKASNFVFEGEAGGTMWTGSRKRDNGVPQEMKQRYVYYCKKGESNA